MYFHVNLNFSTLIKVHLLVNEQYIDSIMHGATIKIIIYVYPYEHILR